MMGARAGGWVESMGSWIGGVVAERVELAQVIGQLRQELSAAMRDGEGKDLRFELGPVELELTVAVSKPETTRSGWRNLGQSASKMYMHCRTGLIGE